MRLCHSKSQIINNSIVLFCMHIAKYILNITDENPIVKFEVTTPPDVEGEIFRAFAYVFKFAAENPIL